MNEAGMHRVHEDVPRRSEQVQIAFDDDSDESTLKEVPHSVVSPVVVLGKAPL